MTTLRGFAHLFNLRSSPQLLSQIRDFILRKLFVRPALLKILLISHHNISHHPLPLLTGERVERHPRLVALGGQVFIFTRNPLILGSP